MAVGPSFGPAYLSCRYVSTDQRECVWLHDHDCSLFKESRDADSFIGVLFSSMAISDTVGKLFHQYSHTYPSMLPLSVLDRVLLCSSSGIELHEQCE